MSKVQPQTGQGVLQPSMTPRERLIEAGGVVRLDDWEWPVFDPDELTTLGAYQAAIGLRITEIPRESSVTDTTLGVYRNDFNQARPENLRPGLFHAHTGPRKSVITIRKWAEDVDENRGLYPGKLPFTTGVAVSEDVYEEMVRSAAHGANQADNQTQRKRLDTMPITEERADLGGESAGYFLIYKHEGLEARDAYLVEEESILRAVHRGATRPSAYRRIAALEPHRLIAEEAIQEMIRIACKSLGYGTNRTHDTQLAAASNMHAPDATEAATWMSTYSELALEYTQEVRGKIGQSIHSILVQLGVHLENLSNNEDREYDI